MTTLLWFTHDLRLNDNAALRAACALGEPILPIYIHDPANPFIAKGAGLWWLHGSLAALGDTIKKQGGKLALIATDINSLISIAKEQQCQRIFFACSHEPWLAEKQRLLYTMASQEGIECRQFAGQLLIEPQSLLNKQGAPYQVFTPFYRQCLQTLSIKEPKKIDANIPWQSSHDLPDSLTVINGIPSKPNWTKSISECWKPGEAAALTLLERAIKKAHQYQEDRDTPSIDGTSKLAPHLHFGEISPRQIWYRAVRVWPNDESAPFLRQLIWREFNYYLLHHFPEIIEAPFKRSFINFPWQRLNPQYVTAWQKGQTGYPIVDAGMRQLWQTGWMHNRVRMIVASFLTKHLRMHWKIGADWFWDTLVDADIANNIGGWQWVAGSGADAAPYFRIFNPVTQSEKFDADGAYLRQWVPELRGLSNRYIHAPWLAPKAELLRANIRLGETYPNPIVDHATARQSALDAYDSMRSSNQDSA